MPRSCGKSPVNRSPSRRRSVLRGGRPQHLVARRCGGWTSPALFDVIGHAVRRTYTWGTGDDDAADSHAGSSEKATVATGSSASLIGRQRELNALVSSLNAAAAGNGAL